MRPRGRKPISAFLTFPPQYSFSHTNNIAPLGGALRCPRRKIWEERTLPVPISRAYMCGLSTDQNTTPHIKRRENQRDTQLSVVRWYLRRQSQKPVLGLSLNLQIIRKALGRRNTDFLGYLRCARPQKNNPSEDRILFELNSLKKNTVEELILAPIFFHLVEKNHPPFFFRYQPPESH